MELLYAQCIILNWQCQNRNLVNLCNIYGGCDTATLRNLADDVSRAVFCYKWKRNACQPWGSFCPRSGQSTPLLSRLSTGFPIVPPPPHRITNVLSTAPYRRRAGSMPLSSRLPDGLLLHIHPWEHDLCRYLFSKSLSNRYVCKEEINNCIW